MGCAEPVREFTVIFESLERYNDEARQSGEAIDLPELEELRVLREFVAEVSEPRQTYYTRA